MVKMNAWAIYLPPVTRTGFFPWPSGKDIQNFSHDKHGPYGVKTAKVEHKNASHQMLSQHRSCPSRISSDSQGILRKQVSFISSKCCNVRFRVKHFCFKACNPFASVTSLKFPIPAVVLAYSITLLKSLSWQLQEATPFSRVTVKDISSRLETIDCQTSCKDL